ncbi:DUF58 domain-containing protein [Candidatus Pyrohabitans sp.]
MEPREILRKVRDIEIRTHRIVDTFLASRYRSTFRGKGIEFAEVREYQYGDDVRYIDWRVTARFGKPYVKEFVEERDLLVVAVVDVSASCDFGTGAATMRERGIEVAATLAYSAFKHGDRFALLLVSDRVESYLPPRKGRGHVYRVVRELVYLKPGSRTTKLSSGLEFLRRVLKERAIIFIISDFFDPSLEEAVKQMRRLSLRGCDVIAVKLSDERNYTLPDVGLVEVLDPESGERLVVNTSREEFRKAYLRRALAQSHRVKEMLRSAGAEIIEIDTSQDVLKPLLRFFVQRIRRR